MAIIRRGKKDETFFDVFPGLSNIQLFDVFDQLRTIFFSNHSSIHGHLRNKLKKGNTFIKNWNVSVVVDDGLNIIVILKKIRGTFMYMLLNCIFWRDDEQ